MPARVDIRFGDLQKENKIFLMKINNLFISASSRKRNIAETMQKESIGFVEPETVFALHKPLCGVYRLHKHRQETITP